MDGRNPLLNPPSEILNPNCNNCIKFVHTKLHYKNTPLPVHSPSRLDSARTTMIPATLFLVTFVAALLSSGGVADVAAAAFGGIPPSATTTIATPPFGTRAGSIILSIRNAAASRSHSTALHAKNNIAGPMARAKKIMGPKEYERVIQTKMKQNKKLTRTQAEAEYNAFLENPNDFALEKKEAYYKSLGYKDLLEGAIGEAEKEGRGDEVRERIENFQKRSKLKGYSVICFFVAVFAYVRSIYLADPDNFLPGI